MVEQHLDPIFQALGHPTRRAMLDDLAAHDRTVGQLAEPHAISLAAASKHVKTLERAGLVHRTVTGRTHLCRLAPEPIEEAHRWLGRYRRFWNDRLDALEATMRRDDAP